MKVSVVISLCDNRYKMFNRALDTWANQTEKDFELILVDDKNRKEFLNLCRKYKSLSFQYLRIDNSKCDVPLTTFTPVLSNNIGIRMSRGDVVCITGPETLQGPNNIKVSATFLNRKEAGYGLIYKSNKDFVNYINNNWNNTFDGLLDVSGAKANCLTCSPHPPGYIYFGCFAKKHLKAIGGFDERFGQGYCGEDDDLASRLKRYGIEPIFEHKIIGIHQDHSRENTEEHLRRYEMAELRKKNLEIWKENNRKKIVVANTEHIWGDPKVIIEHYINGEKI